MATPGWLAGFVSGTAAGSMGEAGTVLDTAEIVGADDGEGVDELVVVAAGALGVVVGGGVAATGGGASIFNAGGFAAEAIASA